MLQFTYSSACIADAANRFWQWAHDSRVIIFSGEMGAGKTTFISALCRLLGVEDAVSSPTFAIVNEYLLPKDEEGYLAILHMDWYRLRDAQEATDAGMEDSLHRDNARVWVEWPEKAPELLRLPHIRLKLEAIGDSERELTAERVA